MSSKNNPTLQVDSRFRNIPHHRKLSTTVLALFLAFYVWDSSIFWDFPTSPAEEIPGVGWRWSAIKPEKILRWHPCYDDKFDCARLDVPLDWLDPTEDLLATIAIIRLNATDRSNYKGPVFINPGGPGGSGIYYLKNLGQHYQAIVGRNHDIISFDPRGVGHTIPKLDCWAGDEQNAKVWALQEEPMIDAHPGVVYDAYANAVAMSGQCASVIGGGKAAGSDIADDDSRRLAEAGPGRFVSTASTARDMLHINELLGETHVKYWGFSYGTFLATTFAAMFPEKVGRVVSDGNVDAEEWSEGHGMHYAADTDKIMDAFFFYCHQAGPANCMLYDETPAAIESRYEAVLSNLKKKPVVVPATPGSGDRPMVVTYSHLRNLVSSAMYTPIMLFPSLAGVLAALETGDGRPFVQLGASGSQDPFSCKAPISDNPSDENPEMPESPGTAHAFMGVMCGESEPWTDTVDDFVEYVAKVANISKVAGATYAHKMRLKCAEWSVRAKWRFAGPYRGNTSHPILWIANIADSVTPLISAQQNARGFPKSSILIQNSYGHTTLSAASRCTANAINTYFQHGRLPKSGTVCEPDFKPFEPLNVTALRSGNREFEVDYALYKLMVAQPKTWAF